MQGIPPFARQLLLTGAFAASLFSGRAQAQATAPVAGTAFDIASVKPANPEARGTRIMMTPGGGVNISNAPLRELISFAYDVRNFQITGGPGWLGSERFDILAKMESSGDEPAPGGPRPSEAQMTKTAEQARQRMQALLAERFQLVVHRESKEMSAYALTVGKSGPKLKEATGEVPGQRGVRMQRGQMNVQSGSLDLVTRVLSNELRRPVVDQTGLKGVYDFELKWVPETPAPGPSDSGGPGPGAAPAASDSAGPSLFTAVQEQLGLKLEARKVPVEMVIVDRADKPSAN